MQPNKTSQVNRCSELTTITVPSSVTEIRGLACDECGCFGEGAFSGCSTLTAAIFLGDAPFLRGGQVFAGTAPGFTIYYLSGSTGFSSPEWTPWQEWWSEVDTYSTIMINEATWPAASWLLTHGLWYDTDLHHDPDGDGVSLLMAYALDLDPRLNLQGSLPVPVRNGNTLSLSFHATSPGITYHVETSTDLQTWKTKGVTQSTPGPDHRSTATVSLDAPRRFLRLIVGD